VSSQVIHNIAQHLINRADISPHRFAVSCALGANKEGRRSYTHLTFQQLNRESAQVAFGLHAIGLKPGMKAVLMVKPGPDLFVLTFALFKAGIAPILIDPGMQRSSLKKCIDQAQPDIFIGIKIAHWARRILRWGSKTLQHYISVKPMWGIDHCLAEIKQQGEEAADDYMYTGHPSDLAAILFTSGSTGTPKGAEYQHRHFVAQVDLLQRTYSFTVGDIDIPTFPLFALFDPALGMSAVFPKMDFSAPLKADPQEIFAVMRDFGAHNLFCSPALLQKLALALPETPPVDLSHSSSELSLSFSSLHSMKRIVSAGAPVSPEAMRRLKQYTQECEIYTPYGATESLPICSISCSEIWQRGVVGQKKGYGVCVGRLVEGVHVEIIPITNQILQDWSAVKAYRSQDPLVDLTVQGYSVGEVVVYAPSTTQNYLRQPQADADSKILGAPPQVTSIEGQNYSHRMGDLGYIDQEGYLWLCGRKSHCILSESHINLPLCIEGIFNEVEGVRRCALAYYRKNAVICVELEKNTKISWVNILQDLSKKSKQFPMTHEIKRFIEHPSFPVDTRHNAKIKREVLSQWLLNKSKNINHI
jgi:olefin beta-lactone synthetase